TGAPQVVGAGQPGLPGPDDDCLDLTDIGHISTNAGAVVDLPCASAQPRKLSRTVRSGLSLFVSTRHTDCQVPSSSRPPTTGSVACGGTIAGRTWSRPCPGLPRRCCQRSSAGSRV